MKKFVLNFIRRLFGINVLIEEFEKINHFNRETSDTLNLRINDLESKILETKEALDTSLKIQNDTLSIQNEIVSVQNKILTKHEVNSINIGGSFNWFAETIKAVEEYYVPVKGSFKDNNGNFTFTNMELESARLIAAITMLQRPKLVLETGTHQGYSAAYMAQSMKNMSIAGHIYTFDPFVVSHLFETEILEDYVTWINDYSTNYLNHDIPSTYDMMVLDSDHTYDTLSKEVEIFEPMLKEGGLMVLHDTNIFKDLWPVVSSLEESKRFEIINFETPRNWNRNDLNGSGITVCKKIKNGDPILVNEKFFKNDNIDKFIEDLNEKKKEYSKRSMFFKN